MGTAVQELIDDLNGLLLADGAELHVSDESAGRLLLELDLTKSACPSCVLPRSMLLELLTARLAEAAPSVQTIDLRDPREDPRWSPPDTAVH